MRSFAPSLIGSQYCSWNANFPRLIFWNSRVCHAVRKAPPSHGTDGSKRTRRRKDDTLTKETRPYSRYRGRIESLLENRGRNTRKALKQ